MKQDLVSAALEHLADLNPRDLPAGLLRVASQSGITDATIYLADLQQASLVAWSDSERPRESVDTSLAGRAFQRGQPTAGNDSVWWFPISDGGDRLGVLRAVLPDSTDDDLAGACRTLSALLGLLITSRGLRTDIIVNGCRDRDVTLAAEMRWAMLPPRSLTAPDICVAGHLEPAYEIAGDSFDYALNGDNLDLAIFDAMGHGLTASRLANLAIAGYRHSRREGNDLSEIYRDIDEAVLSEFGDGEFATAHLLRLHVPTGELSVVNAGHPGPLLIRAGSAHPLELQPATPMGLGLVEAAVGTLRLEPGDAVVLFSDGMTEARSAGGDLFTVERVGDLAARAIAGGDTIAETARRLIRNVIEHRGVSLEDDATLVMVGWRI